MPLRRRLEFLKLVQIPLTVMRVFTITFILSVALIVGGFFFPPTGVIDGSVLSAVGLLLMFATIDKVPDTIKAGKSIKLQRGDTSIEVNSDQD